MRIRFTATPVVFLAALGVMAPDLAAQEAVPSFASGFSYPVPPSITPPQSTGEKSVALAVALNALIFPGLGNFYAGNNGHGWRHVGLAVGGGVIFLVGAVEAVEYDFDNDDGGALLVVGALILAGNWVWSIVSAVKDAEAAGRPPSSGGALPSMLRPRLVPLGLDSEAGGPMGRARVGLQLIEVRF